MSWFKTLAYVIVADPEAKGKENAPQSMMPQIRITGAIVPQSTYYWRSVPVLSVLRMGKLSGNGEVDAMCYMGD